MCLWSDCQKSWTITVFHMCVCVCVCVWVAVHHKFWVLLKGQRCILWVHLDTGYVMSAFVWLWIELATSWMEDCMVTSWHFEIVLCYFFNMRETQMLCFLVCCYMIMCNLSYVRKNQNLWNLVLCNLFMAIVFAKLVPGLEFRCAGIPLLFPGSFPVQ